MTKQPKLIESIYRRLGPVYNFLYSKLLFNEGRETAIEFLDLKPGMKVLEVGVGTGLTLPLYHRECAVVGVDLSESMLAEAEALIRQKKLTHCQVKMMDATQLQFSDSTFDAVLGNLFISATTFPEKSLEEMKRVCKPGGRIVLMNHFRSKSALMGFAEEIVDPVTRSLLGFTAALEMEPLLDKVHLKPIRIQKVNLLNLWTAVSMLNEK